ncbi:MAG: GNAT family N-acetyltransferase [Rhodobacteraceae bacterium]|nr:GNAT family N-acetyltransferase [Paracoccaceae bacterium]
MSPSLSLRTAHRGDAPEVDALLSRSYPTLLKPDYPPSAMVMAVPLLARGDPSLAASGRYYVAEIGGVMVGAGGWSFGNPHGGDMVEGLGHVRHLVVDPGYIHQGIGRRLMDRILRKSRAEGITRLECTSTRTALAFFESAGFVAEEVTELELGAGIGLPAIKMTRDL